MISTPENKQLRLIEAKTCDIVSTAEQLIIDSQGKYDKCATFLRGIKGLKKEIDVTFDQNIKDAHQLHKNLVATKKGHYEPLERAEAIVKKKSITWAREQELARLEAQRKADEAAQKAEAKRKATLEAQAKRHEEKGNTAKAAERREQADQTFVPSPEVQSNFEQASGQSIQTLWKARVTDMVALCRAVGDGTLPAYMVSPNMLHLNTLARTMKESKQYPGVQFYSEESMSVRG